MSCCWVKLKFSEDFAVAGGGGGFFLFLVLNNFPGISRRGGGAVPVQFETICKLKLFPFYCCG